MVGAIPQPDPVIGVRALSGLGRLSSLGDDIGGGKRKAARQICDCPHYEILYTADLRLPQKRQKS